MSRSFKALRLNRVLSVVIAFAMVFSTTSGLIASAAIEDSLSTVETQLDSSTGLPVMGLEVHSFATSQTSAGNNASLNWAVDGVEDVTHFAVYKSIDGQDYKKCYITDGNSWLDYELSEDHTYKYRVVALDSDETAVAVSNEAYFTPVAQTSDMELHSNVTGGELVYETSGTKVGDTYYSYSMKSNSGSYYLVESTSTDGKNFDTQRTVADESQNSDLGSCKLESVQMKYVESKNIMMIWAHWELPSGYGSGKALVITGTPGGEFTVHNIYNPLGVYVRDMSIFLDDDDTAYLAAASNESGQGANATIYIFKMNDTYSDVTEVVKKLHENQYREFPCLIKRDGYYYLFTSQAAGWYPSKGGYTVTKSLSGEWSDLRSIGDSSTFSSQSGWIQSIGNGDNCVMHAYRWISSSDTAGSTLCPVYFANGFAFYDYCTSFRYNMQNNELLPVQDGELLSLNKPVTSSISSSTLEYAVDGSYENAFVGDEKTWPFNIQIDLLKECNLSDIQISWYICKGSEGYYTYYVEGSTDGENWTTLLDRTDESSDRVTNTYGFTNDELSGTARYVRLTVTNAHLHNNTNNWYTPKIYEIKVFGEPADSSSQTKTENQPIAAYQLDKSEISNGKISDKTGRNGELVLYGDYSINSTADSIDSSEQTEYIGESTQPIYFSGSDGCYAELPDGLLSGTNEFSISIRARSDTAFSDPYFTLGIGNDSTQYLIFKLGKDYVRFNITNNSWMGETGIKTQADGENWHTYTITVDETTAKLYVDKQLVGENYKIGELLSNFGDNTKLYLGKSFYSSDQYFKGSISSICFYDYALSEDNVAQMKNTVYYVGAESSSIVDSSSVAESSSAAESSSVADSSSVAEEIGEPEHVKTTYTLDGMIGINCLYTIPSEYVNGDYTINAEFTGDNEAQTIALNKEATETVDGETAYMFTFPIQAYNMTKSYQAKIVVTDANGNTVAESASSTLKVSGCFRSIQSGGDEKLKNLASALKTYGYYLQKQFNSEAALPTSTPNDLSDVTLETMQEYAQKKETISLTNKLSLAGTTMIVNSGTTIRFYISDLKDYSLENLRLRYSADGEVWEESELKYNSSMGMYYGEIPNIGATKLSNMYKAYFVDGETQVSDKITYGAYSYIFSVLRASSTYGENTTNIVKALYKYSVAAEEYINQ